MTEHSWEGIVKVQIPLGGDMSQALIYDETRVIQAFVPVSEVQPIAGDRPKFFMTAHLDASGQLHLEQDAGWQSW